MYYYSKSMRGFYHASVHNQIPMDRVEVTDEQHAALMQAQAEGKVIVAGEDGLPVAVPPEKRSRTPLEQIAELEAAITPRRVREFLMNAEDPKGWLKTQESKITAIRKKLVQAKTNS